MAEQLIRAAHGCVIISTQNEAPVEGSDGWSHVLCVPVKGVIPTYGQALALAREHDRSQGDGNGDFTRRVEPSAELFEESETAE